MVQKNGAPKKRWKGVAEKDMLVRELKRTDKQSRLFMEAWLQKPTHPCLQGKQARFQEDEKICQHSYNI